MSPETVTECDVQVMMSLEVLGVVGWSLQDCKLLMAVGDVWVRSAIT